MRGRGAGGGRSPWGPVSKEEMSSLQEASQSEMDKLRSSCAVWDGGSPQDGAETNAQNSLDGQREGFLEEHT